MQGEDLSPKFTKPSLQLASGSYRPLFLDKKHAAGAQGIIHLTIMCLHCLTYCHLSLYLPLSFTAGLCHYCRWWTLWGKDSLLLKSTMGLGLFSRSPCVILPQGIIKLLIEGYPPLLIVEFIHSLLPNKNGLGPHSFSFEDSTCTIGFIGLPTLYSFLNGVKQVT